MVIMVKKIHSKSNFKAAYSIQAFNTASNQ